MENFIVLVLISDICNFSLYLQFEEYETWGKAYIYT